MDNPPVANPKILLAVAAAVGVILSTIAIFIAVSYSPSSPSNDVTTTAPSPSTTPAVPSRP